MTRINRSGVHHQRRLRRGSGSLRRATAPIVPAALGALVLLCCGCGEPRRPNVVWVLLDTARTDFSTYGYERETTPNIDALAQRGVVFESHFSQGNRTAVSVPSFMTGKYFPAPSIGLHGQSFDYRNIRLPSDGERLAPEIFRDSGYDTAMISVAHAWFSDRNRLPRAFDVIERITPRDPPKLSFDEINTAAFDYLAQDRSKPFFLYLHTWDAHFPHRVERGHEQWLEPGLDTAEIERINTLGTRSYRGEFLSPETVARIRGLYDGSVHYADAHFGALMRKLEELRLLDDTIVVISSDHGEALGENGRTLGHGLALTYDEVTQVPLILAGPRIPSGRRVTAVTENVDILPTLLEVLGLQPKVEMDGASLVPLFDGDTRFESDDVAFTRAGPVFSLRSSASRYDYHLTKRTETLLGVPDLVATRRELADARPDELERLRGILESRILPAYEASRRAPLMAVFVPVTELLPEDPKERLAIGVRLSHDQTPLTMARDDDAWLLHAGLVYADGASEAPPRLSLKAQVPNGNYSLLAEVYCTEDYGGVPASSLLFKAEEDQGLSSINCDGEDTSGEGLRFLRVGRYEIVDGSLEVEIAAGKAAWAILRSLVLVPRSRRAELEFNRLLGSRSLGAEEIAATREQLRALGYL